MILVEFETPVETKNITYGRPALLDRQWEPGVSGLGQISQAISRNFGGYFQTQPSTIDILPHVFSSSEYPPLDAYPTKIKWANSGSTNETTAFQFFEGTACFNRMVKGGGISFSLYSTELYDAKIDLDADWSGINDDTLVNVISNLCGESYLGLVVDFTYARDSSPNVSVTLTGETLCIDLVKELCEFYNHCFYIKAGVLYLIDMFGEVGDEIVLASEEIISGEYSAFSPVSKITVSGEDGWGIVEGNRPGFGQDISLTKYHDTEANALIEMNLIKATLEKNKATVRVPIDFLSEIPVLGQKISWLDKQMYYTLTSNIFVRGANWDLLNGIVSLSGDSNVGAYVASDPSVYTPELGGRILDTTGSPIKDTSGDFITDTG